MRPKLELSGRTLEKQQDANQPLECTSPDRLAILRSHKLDTSRLGKELGKRQGDALQCLDLLALQGRAK